MNLDHTNVGLNLFWLSSMLEVRQCPACHILYSPENMIEVIVHSFWSIENNLVNGVETKMISLIDHKSLLCKNCIDDVI